MKNKTRPGGKPAPSWPASLAAGVPHEVEGADGGFPPPLTPHPGRRDFALSRDATSPSRDATSSRARGLWPSRLQPQGRKFQPDDLFPLPRMAQQPWKGTGDRRRARFRSSKYEAVLKATNQSIDALNVLYGVDHPEQAGTGVRPNADRVTTTAHSSMHHTLSTKVSRGWPSKVLSDRASFHALAGKEVDYSNNSTSVVPYDSSKLSLPGGQVTPVPLEGLLAGELAACLNLDNILADDDVIRYRTEEHVEPYTDVVIASSRSARQSFLTSLYKCGILGFSRSMRGRITPFCVKKKGDKQRLVLDCRAINKHFRYPPKPEMANVECIGQLAAAHEGSDVFIGTADIKNCFYQCGVPKNLSRYFAFDAVPSSWALDMGALTTIDGEPIYECGRLYPVLLVLPMGWSWSFYIVQMLHIQILVECGFKQEHIISSSWPSSLLSTTASALPYCDNLTVFGTSKEGVDRSLGKLMEVFKEKGFELHEIEWGRTGAEVLGVLFNGSELSVRGRPDRVWALRGALRYIAAGHPVSGRTLERLLGHFIVEALHQREALSILKSVYVFVREHYWVPKPVYRSVAHELMVAAGLLPVLSGNLGRSWSSEVGATDAATNGWGMCERKLDPGQVRAIGVWNERWRFRRLEPSEWAPRRRAFDPPPDPILDPSTVVLEDDPFLGTEPTPSELQWAPRAGFPEVPPDILKFEDWQTLKAGRFKFKESIGAKEGRALLRYVNRKSADPSQHHRNHLVLIDNFGVALSFSRFRSGSFGYLQLIRRLAALSIATDVKWHLRWIPSERNPADRPSRRFDKIAEQQEDLYGSKEKGVASSKGAGGVDRYLALERGFLGTSGRDSQRFVGRADVHHYRRAATREVRKAGTPATCRRWWQRAPPTGIRPLSCREARLAPGREPCDRGPANGMRASNHSAEHGGSLLLLR